MTYVCGIQKLLLYHIIYAQSSLVEWLLLTYILLFSSSFPFDCNKDSKFYSSFGLLFISKVMKRKAPLTEIRFDMDVFQQSFSSSSFFFYS